MLTFRIPTRKDSYRNLYIAWRKLTSIGKYVSHRTLSTTRSSPAGLLELQSNMQVQIRKPAQPDYPFDDPDDSILSHPDYFGVKELVTVRDLFNARVHYGHKAGCRNEYMNEFLFGSRLGIDIFDLDQTLVMLQDALNFIAHIAFRQGPILFVSRNVQTLPLVERTAKECGEYSQCRKWGIGLFTNTRGSFQGMIRLPDLGIFLSTKDAAFEQHLGIMECAKMCIPTVGIVDSNCDPRLVSYPIPGNDDTPEAIRLYLRLFKEAIKRGKAEREKWKKEDLLNDSKEEKEDNMK